MNIGQKLPRTNIGNLGFMGKIIFVGSLKTRNPISLIPYISGLQKGFPKPIF